jgi:O-antigen/teichoic acid export membrane protein
MYFIPKESFDKERVLVKNTVLLQIATSVLSSVFLAISYSFWIGSLSGSFAVWVVVYVFLFLNVDIFEGYYLAKKKPNKLLYISTFLSVTRLGAVMIPAYFFGKTQFIVYSLVCFEIFRILASLLWMWKKSFIKIANSSQLMKKQYLFCLPIGLSNIVNTVNQRAGELLISIKNGTELLAIYSVGAYQLPILSVIRSAVSDSIFPDIVKQKDKLYLWRNSNIIYLIIVLPIVFLLFVNSKLFISTLFTEQYLAAEPIFKIMLLVLIRQCFEMSTPLRAVGKNHYGLIACLIGLVVNISLLSLYDDQYELWYPAIVLLITDLTIAIILSMFVMKEFKINLPKLLLFGDILKLLVVFSFAAGFYYFVEYLLGTDSIFDVFVKTGFFLLFYSVLVRYANISTVLICLSKIQNQKSGISNE